MRSFCYMTGKEGCCYANDQRAIRVSRMPVWTAYPAADGGREPAVTKNKEDKKCSEQNRNSGAFWLGSFPS